MIIRQYRKSDEREWLRCRVASFLDCSYWNDVKTAKEAYPHPGISFVAEENGTIIGLIDIELDSSDLYRTDKGRGAIIWDLAVLQEYRKTGIAKKL
jgi:GNAT superfamily N-acetyltransferase